MTVVDKATFDCGPLEICVTGGPQALFDKVAEALLLFDHAWTSRPRRVGIRVEVAPPVAQAEGNYLSCARMMVRADSEGTLQATTLVGAAAFGCSGPGGDDWTISVPPDAVVDGRLEDVEDLVGLALTTGWRRAGWVPVHAAGIVHRSGVCAVLCAPSGGGKSTLTAALVRRGWRMLGDDKLLARIGADGKVRVAALLHTFNLDPSTQAWFPEVGDLEQLPRYSVWTPKRKVFVSSIWDGAVASGGLPTHVVALSRGSMPGSVSASRLPPATVLSTLLRQTVIPADRRTAASISSVVAACAAQVAGLAIEIGDDAYRYPEALDRVEETLLS